MFLELIRNRRSIRKFKDMSVEPEKVELILEAALRSPSSRAINPWEYILLDDRKLITELAKSKPHGASFLANTPLVVVVLADISKSDVWIEDCSIGSTYIQLAAESLGLKSCWIQIRLREHSDDISADEFIRNSLNVPGNLTVHSMVAIGYPDEVKPGHNKDELLQDKISLNSYGAQR